MQWRRATRKYQINNREKYLETQNKCIKNYYHTHEDCRIKQSNRYKLRYQNDDEYKNKIKEQALNHYYNKINKLIPEPLTANISSVHAF